MKVAVSQEVPLEWNQARIMAILRTLETQLNLLAEGRLAGRHFSGAAAPTTGDFSRGDIVWNSEPAATEFIGWVCVTAGSPGTFKGFGEIEA